MIKCTGKEWREFCKALPDCLWFDYCTAPDEYADADALRFNGGEVSWQCGEVREVLGVISRAELDAVKERSAQFAVETLFRRWKKAQTTQTVMVEIPKADAEKFVAMMKANGWKVMK